jgi:hypothetical protein
MVISHITIIRIYIKAILRIVVVEFLHTLYQLILKLARTDLNGHFTDYYNSYLYKAILRIVVVDFLQSII